MKPTISFRPGFRSIALLAASLISASCVTAPTTLPSDYVGPKDCNPQAASAVSKQVPTKQKRQGPLTINLSEAVFTALENNPAFLIDRLELPISRTDEALERSDFDPTISFETAYNQGHDRTDASDSTESRASENRSYTGVATYNQFLPTGTNIALRVAQGFNNNWASTLDSDGHSTGYDISATQSLLRGAGTAVNLAQLRQARLDIKASEYEVRGAAQALVAEVEQTYWDYILTERSIEIYTKSVEIAEQQIAEVKERIRLGGLAETDLTAAEAEVASRQEDLINARGQLQTTRLELLRLINPNSAPDWSAQIHLTEKPETAFGAIDTVENHVAVALLHRPDLNQAHLQVRRGELEVIRTHNGLLPRLDLFANIGHSRYASSVSGSDRRDSNGTDFTAGFVLEYTLGNRAERATHQRSLLSLTQTQEALRNFTQLVQLDVRSAHVNVNVAIEQIKATTATRKLREKTYSIEKERLRLGRSTALLVAQAWRDLVASQIGEVEAVVGYRKALIELYRLEGTLLDRRGIDAPGQASAAPKSQPQAG